MELRAQEAAAHPFPSPRPRSTAASASPRELDELMAGRRLPSSGEMCQPPDGRPHLPQPRRYNTRGMTSGRPGQEDEEGDVDEVSVDEALLPIPRRSQDCKELGEVSLAVGAEVKRQLWLAGPLIVGSLMQNLIQTISVMFVGHLGELPLAGASMATSFATVTGFSLLTGMSNALDTLCGQAFGAGQYHLLGIYKQRAMLLLTVVSIPVAIMWFYTGQIMLLFGQDPEIAMEAGMYARWMIPGLFGYGLLQCHVRFLQSQNTVLPVMVSAGAAALFHLLACWLLVHVAGMGSKGAALSTAVSYWVYVILLAMYVRVSSSCKQTWTGFSMQAFHGAHDFLRLAVPSALMLCLEWWSFEILVLLSGLLPNPKLETSVLSITLNTANCLFMIPYGLGAAISTRVSNELGAGRPRAARLAVHVVMFLAISEGTVMAAVVVRVRYIWGHAYSSEEEVVSYVARMLLVILVVNFFDGIQCVLSGVARGCGWQKMCAFINLGAFYVVGVPAAYLIAFVLRVGGMGLWMGIICGVLVQVMLLTIITLCTNWQKEAMKAKNRVFNSSIPTDRSTHDMKISMEVSCY
ncbi:protein DETOXIFICATION 16-like isoform X1 [Triticum dicoccoides]|uniref:protein DETOXIFICATION 16-like isoform X1 n=1 Tax=Triticum dicoccoides TaxID=85692 RepID=UPI00188E224A|nr:protein DETOXIFICATION 16-like isoform X1 [Triticum dicoccoides]